MQAERTVIGRYAIAGEIAAGGMATVHYGRLLGPVGFSRTVAIKRLHPQFAKDPEFVSMFLDEARLAARIRHPNVVATLDVVATEGELFVVMEYLQGESLSRLHRAAKAKTGKIPLGHVVAILSGVLHGLHAAHEARNERGEPLGIVHRDVSPQNVLVGVDGVVRVLDFGIAKAAGRVHTTREGQIKGKLAYMAPEQLQGGAVDRRTDVYAAAVVLWELVAGRRLFETEEEAAAFHLAKRDDAPPPSAHAADVPEALDRIVQKGLARRRDDRFASAREMAIALEKIAPMPTPRELGEWVEDLAKTQLAHRAERIAEIESISEVTRAPDPRPPGSTPITHASALDVVTPRGKPSELPASDVSSVSAARDQRQSHGARRTGIIAALAALGGVAIGALVLEAARRAPTDTTTHDATTSAHSEIPSAPPLPVAMAAPSAPSVPASAPAATSASPPADTHPTPTAHGTTKKPPTSRPASCNPPYVILPDGLRSYKPECLK